MLFAWKWHFPCTTRNVHCELADASTSTYYDPNMVSLHVNGAHHTIDVPPDTPLLWVIRDELALTGTKFGCGVAQCGACTVHVNGEATRSCSFPVSGAVGKDVRTIESLSRDNSHPVQQAWIAEQVPQCGYCQSGQIMAAVALLRKHPHPSNEQIDQTMTNICRCGTYDRIRSAIHRAATEP
jgi:isoquinoline 1-oxidoreductase subunit alpha